MDHVFLWGGLVKLSVGGIFPKQFRRDVIFVPRRDAARAYLLPDVEGTDFCPLYIEPLELKISGRDFFSFDSLEGGIFILGFDAGRDFFPQKLVGGIFIP